jgi:hypothetical protein
MSSPRFNSVEEYLASVDPTKERTLRSVIDLKFVVMKKCFQIPVDWKIDKRLVKDLVRARLAELD